LHPAFNGKHVFECVCFGKRQDFVFCDTHDSAPKFSRMNGD
jgi:hypothetical protein